MNINRKKQSQFELFPGTSKSSPEMGKQAHLTKDLTLSLENIIVLCIIFVMSLVLFFSFGVEKGKWVAGASYESRLAKENEKIASNPAGSDAKAKQGERVVFPVDIPEDLIKDSDPDSGKPLRINDEQGDLFTIQVASFKLRKNAQREADRLKGNGHEDAFVLPKGSYTIVCVGKFSQKADAEKFSSKLPSRYNDSLVRRL